MSKACCAAAEVLFDAGTPAGVKALFVSLYSPELQLAAILPHQVQSSA